MWMCTYSMHVLFPGLYVWTQHFYSHIHTKHTWPSITVCRPLRQQMLQPCHNSLAVWNQTVSLGPLRSNLLTPQCANLTIAYHGLLYSCALTLHWIKQCAWWMFAKAFKCSIAWGTDESMNDCDLYFLSFWMCNHI